MFSDDAEGRSDVDCYDEELEPVENTCVNFVNFSLTNLNKRKQIN